MTGGDTCHGYKKSPLKERFEIEFDIPTNLKPYRAHWMINDNQLKIIYVNGTINNEEKYTTYNTNYQKEYYIKNKQLKINYVLGKRAYNKECKRLCSILL